MPEAEFDPNAALTNFACTCVGLFAYTVGYDWSKGVSGQMSLTPEQRKGRLMLHVVNQVRPICTPCCRCLATEQQRCEQQFVCHASHSGDAPACTGVPAKEERLDRPCCRGTGDMAGANREEPQDAPTLGIPW